MLDPMNILVCQLSSLSRSVLIKDQLLCKKCPHSELFWSAFSRIWTEYEEILRIFQYSVRMRENADQNNSEYGHLLHIELLFCFANS